MVCSRCPRENRYYQTVLKKKCIQKLKNNAWETKTKWILFEKADEHYRRKIFKKYFQVLSAYANEQLVKRVNKEMSDSFYHNKLMSKVIEVLKNNLEQKKMIIEMYNQRTEWNLRINVMHKWKHYTLMRLKVKKVKNLADRIREEKLTIKFLYAWFLRLNEKLYLQEADAKATIKWQSHLLRKYLFFWTIYKKRRIAKSHLNELLRDRYNRGLKSFYLHSWIQYRKRKKALGIISKSFKKLRETDLCRKYLKIWTEKYDIICLKKEIQNSNTAQQHHEKKLLRKCLQKLRKAKQSARLMKQKCDEFQDHSNRIRLNFYIDLWIQKKNEKMHWEALKNEADDWRDIYLTELYLEKIIQRAEEKREEAKRDMEILNYSNATVLYKAFNTWRKFTGNKNNKRISLEKSIKFYEVKLLKKGLKGLNEYRLMRIKKKLIMDHWRFFTLENSFNCWKNFLKSRRLVLEKVEEMRESKDVKILKSAFQIWKSQIFESKLKLRSANDFSDRKTRQKYFLAWRKRSEQNRMNRLRFTQNLESLRAFIVEYHLLKWREMLFHKRSLQEKIKIAKRKREYLIKSQIFQKWQNLIKQIKDINNSEILFPKVKNYILLQMYVNRIVEALKSRRALKAIEDFAAKKEELSIKKKYFKKWRSFIHWKRSIILNHSACERKSEGFENSNIKFEKIFSKKKGLQRRQPMIPDYLKAEFDSNESNGSFTYEGNDLTYRILEPINKHLPIIDHDEMFISFDQ